MNNPEELKAMQDQIDKLVRGFKAALPEAGSGIITTAPNPPGTGPIPPTPPLPASWNPNYDEAYEFTNKLWREGDEAAARWYWRKWCQMNGRS